MRDEDFEWDDENAVSNFAKHCVTFEHARTAFDDPGSVDRDDHDSSEGRYKRLCRLGVEVLVVIWTERGDRVRIISARKATKHEQRSYYQDQA